MAHDTGTPDALVLAINIGTFDRRGDRAPPRLAQTPPPNPTAAEPDGRRVLSRVGAADHAVTPQAPWTGSGWREYSYGGFGGGHPNFHRQAERVMIQIGVTPCLCKTSQVSDEYYAEQAQVADSALLASLCRRLSSSMCSPSCTTAIIAPPTTPRRTPEINVLRSRCA